MAMNQVHLFVPFFQSSSTKTQDKLCECVWRNNDCQYIDSIWLLVEDPFHMDAYFELAKVRVVRPPQRTRQTFGDMLALMRQPEHADSVNILANSDIYFDDTLSLIDEATLPDNACFALSRVDCTLAGDRCPFWDARSQDAWIFRGSPRAVECDAFYFGRPGCENRFAHELQRSGYVVSNPCKSIFANHLHESGMRTYSSSVEDAVPPPYLHVQPVWLTGATAQNVDDVFICLCMIVKNESATIARCIESCAHVVDAVCICDTGSSDDTKAIIGATCQRLRLPYCVWSEPFQNFGHNRTASFRKTRAFCINDLGRKAARCYALLMDADAALRGTLEDKNALTASCYSLMQRCQDTQFFNRYLIRCDVDWTCRGRAHEYWAAPDNQPLHDGGRLAQLWLYDYNDGGCHADKYEREERLLLEDLRDDPNNARSLFYLARGYYVQEKLDQAIEFFVRRTALSHVFPEEAFVAVLYQARCHARLARAHNDQWARALQCYMDAMQRWPARAAEVCLDLAEHFENKGEHALAHHFASSGLLVHGRNGVPNGLFVDASVYEWNLLMRVCVSAYYAVGQRHDGLAASDQLMQSRVAPPHIVERARKNITFYLPSWPHSVSIIQPGTDAAGNAALEENLQTQTKSSTEQSVEESAEQSTEQSVEQTIPQSINRGVLRSLEQGVEQSLWMQTFNTAFLQPLAGLLSLAGTPETLHALIDACHQALAATEDVSAFDLHTATHLSVFRDTQANAHRFALVNGNGQFIFTSLPFVLKSICCESNSKVSWNNIEKSQFHIVITSIDGVVRAVQFAMADVCSWMAQRRFAGPSTLQRPRH